MTEWKKEVKQKILSFPLRPSIVVDTKNGYHVYWLLKDGQHQLFRHIQMQLIQYFGGDKQCVNESRVLRLIGFQHRKNPQKPYPIRCKIFEPKNKYTQEELKNVLPQLWEELIGYT